MATSIVVLAMLGASQLNSVMAAGQDNIDLVIGQETSQYQLSANEAMYFQLKLARGDFTGNEDLLIKVSSNEYTADPDVYLSKKNTKPNSKANSEYACETSGRDICSIHHSELSVNQYIYVGVKCLDECKFRLSPQLSEPMILEDSILLQADFNPNESRLFKFYVPAASSSKDEESKVTSVTITAVPILSQLDNIILAATSAKDQTPSTKSLKGVPGWRKGQVLRMSETTSPTEWCSDCWITVLVDVVDSGKYSIMAKSNVGVLQLQTDTKIDDVAFFGDRTCYKYYVQSTDSDLIVKVQQYSGLISFTINPKKPAESYDSAAFRHVGASSSVLKITSADRKSVSQPKGVYYICAVPHMTSTFSLMVSEPSKNQMFSYLDDGYDEMGEVQGTDLNLYVYKVPPLEYKGEDIELKFKLTVNSGKSPVLGAAFCLDKKDHKKCVTGIKSSEVTAKDSVFSKSSQVGKDLYITINHDERQCQDEYSGQCYYVIAVVGQSNDTTISTYTLSVNHAQLNYELLSENQPVSDFVMMGQHRYYSFTLMPDSRKIQSVSFKLTTLHGDADIYVSRIHPFPTKIDYEKSSVKTNVVEDEVEFTSSFGNLTCTYYVLVMSFQYSSYNLLVKVKREGIDEKTDEGIVLLSEGVPLKGKINGISHLDHYKINVKQVAGYEKSIRIQLQPTKGNFEIYINYNKRANEDNYFASSKDNYLEISTKNKNFHSQGTYYIAVRPRKNLWAIITDNHYEYIITYSTQDSYLYLSSKEALETTQSAQSLQYFRHFISHKEEDISVSLTVLSGGNPSPQLYISLNPENKFPTKQQFDYSSNTLSNLFANGKSVYISSQEVQASSEQCGADIDEYVDMEPCALFVGVYCEVQCKYSLKLTYERGAPQKITFGMPQHDIVKQGSFNYYYLIVREGKSKQIYAVLNSATGNGDLYVNFQENPQNSAPEKWRLPTQTQYSLKSNEVMKQDMVNIQENTLKDCFSRFSGGSGENERICGIIFGIYTPSVQIDDDEDIDDYNALYNFVVYSDIVFIQNGALMSGHVNEREFQYYVFDAQCSDCPIVVSLSTYSSNGDPDLYISYGDHSLPTLTTYDIYSSTYKSELVRISMDQDEVKDKKIKTLKGQWIFGVYGVRKSDFAISVTQDKNPTTQMATGISLKSSQSPYETSYFMYYHDKDQTDLEIMVDPTIGKLDVFVNVFKDEDASQNYISQLPKSKRNSLWIKEGIQATSTHDQKTLTILNEESNFCSHCYYLIAVISQDQRAEYNIMAHPLDANFQNSLLLRVGDIQSYHFKRGDKAFFKFLIDENEDVKITINSKQGFVKAGISKNEDNNYFAQIESNKPYIFEKTNQNFKVNTVFYLIATCDMDSSFTVQLDQERNILTLRDGVAQKVYLKSEVPRHFIFPLPSGSQALSIQIKSNQDHFYPQLLFRETENIKSPKSLEFPPLGAKYNSFFNWDRNFGTLIAQKNIKLTSNNGGVAITLIENSKIASGEVIITVSISSTVELQPLHTYQGSLNTENSFMIYHADQYFGIGKGFIRVEFANCQGHSQMILVDNADGMNSKQESIDFQEKHELGRTYYHIPLPRKSLYLMVKPNLVSYDRSKPFVPHQYLLKVKYLPSLDASHSEHTFQETNRLKLESYSSIFQTANMTWKPILTQKVDGVIVKADQSYVIVITTDANLNLENICQARTQNQTNIMADTRTFIINQSHFEIPYIKTDHRYYINVFSRLRFNYNEELEVIPYEPYELHIRPSSIFNLTNIFGLILVILIGASCYQIYQRGLSKSSGKPYYRQKEPSRQVEFELTQVASRNSSHGEYQVPTELVKDVSETDRLNTSGN